MKNQILMLIIGILIGAVITTGVFLVLQSGNSNDMGEMSGERPTMDGNMVGGGEMPSGDMPSGDMTSNSNTTVSE